MRISEKIKRFFKFSLMTLIIAGGGNLLSPSA